MQPTKYFRNSPRHGASRGAVALVTTRSRSGAPALRGTLAIVVCAAVAVLMLALAPGNAEAIINGTAVTAKEREDKGLVILDSGNCSGVLLANDWVLKAGHCVARRRLTRRK